MSTSPTKKILKKSLAPQPKRIMNDMVVRAKSEHVESRQKNIKISKRYKIIITACVVVSVVFFSLYKLPFAKADIEIFYPQNCLGGWQNPQAVAGKPDTSIDYNPQEFTESNSAVLKNTTAQLYCGGFEGKIPEKTIPTKIILRPVWSIEDGSIVRPTGDSVQTVLPEVDPASVETQPLESQDLGVDPKTQPDEIIPSVESPNSSPINEEEPLSFFNTLIAYAQESEQAPIITEPAQAEIKSTEVISTEQQEVVPSEANQDIIIPETVSVSDSEAIKSEEQDELKELEVESKESEPVELVPVSEPVVRISYTLDGVNWNMIGEVNRTNWREQSFEIPLVGWSDLAKFQVSIESLITIDTPPIIYLDAMSLEVSYAEFKGNKNSDIKNLHIDKFNNEKSSLSFSVIDDPDQGEMIIISGTQETDLHFYNNDDSNLLMTSALGKGDVIFPVYQFDPGTFTLIETIGANACIGQTLDECKSSPEYQGETTFTLIQS
jgi:hypothetical protein